MNMNRRRFLSTLLARPSQMQSARIAVLETFKIVDLLPGDRLIMFTDGVTKATDSSGEEFGEARLIAADRRPVLPRLRRLIYSFDSPARGGARARSGVTH